MADKWSTVRVEIIEMDRFSGQKVFDRKEFPTKEEADDFVTEYNSQNNEDVVPDYYTYARIV